MSNLSLRVSCQNMSDLRKWEWKGRFGLYDCTCGNILVLHTESQRSIQRHFSRKKEKRKKRLLVPHEKGHGLDVEVPG